jgi:hypothetical protein
LLHRCAARHGMAAEHRHRQGRFHSHRYPDRP